MDYLPIFIRYFNTCQFLTDPYRYWTDTYQYLDDYFLFNWSFTNAKLILINFLIQINIYQNLTVTYQYLVNQALIVKHS